MFITYHSNQLEVLQQLLLKICEKPLSSPFQQEVVLVQSPSMAQWLQLQIAQQTGIAANFSFPMPARFLWQQYLKNFDNIPQQMPFSREAMVWRLMRIIPQYLNQAVFQPLAHYLQQSPKSEQEKLYQLAHKIADLFDQYLVYRPEWIEAWQQHQELALPQIQGYMQQQNWHLGEQLEKDIEWQATLWRALLADVQDQSQVLHRADLHKAYLQLLQTGKAKHLPERLFIFGISALPKTYMDSFYALSQHIDVHLFFNNPCRYYWGDLVDTARLQKLQIQQRLDHRNQQKYALFSPEQKQRLIAEDFERNADQELLQQGNPLLASWGKQGRDFLYLLSELDTTEIDAFADVQPRHLLSQVQNAILNLTPNKSQKFHWQSQDNSIRFHSCHSPMREVEVLHDSLLHLFQQDPTLTPKDVVVMVADINQYQPYIQAVFGQYQRQDKCYIPFSIADEKLSESDVLIAGFLNLLKLKESQFSAEEVLALLNIPAIRNAFSIELYDLEKIRHWVEQTGIRFGLDKTQSNYNAWQAGLERMLLGYAMREENGIWQDSIGYDASYGLQSELVGALSHFIQHLKQWQQLLLQPHSIQQWQQHLHQFIDIFFVPDLQDPTTLLFLKDCIDSLAEQLESVHFSQDVTVEVLTQALMQKLEDNPLSQKFLVGKVSFCTLLPMRAIPFKAVCLLGMNEKDYPRQQTYNSFDLMQYYQQKGDRSRRNDDRYLFLEALLAAQDYFYVSYVGRSIIDNQEFEPSVLVSQLQDYLCENIDMALLPNETVQQYNERVKSLLVEQHAMTIFSANNFLINQPAPYTQSFARQWLNVGKKTHPPLADFNQVLPIHHKEQTAYIDFDQIVAFVQNPVRHFFEKRLGVYFTQESPLIADSENFELNKLEQYLLKEQLLYAENERLPQLFQELNLKGLLPRGEFATLSLNQQQALIKPFKPILDKYSPQEKQQQNFEISFVLPNQQNVLLSGTLDNLYGEFLQPIFLRIGKNKEKNIIQYWLYYLVQTINNPNAVPPRWFYADKEKVMEQSFNLISKEQAWEQLQIYIQDYLRSEQQMQIVVIENISKYLELLATTEETQDFNQHYAFLEKIAYYDNNVFVHQDYYWQRLLQQSQQLDFPQINQKTKNWFELMQQQLTQTFSI